jgi:RHS repeat-associated protein
MSTVLPVDDAIAGCISSRCAQPVVNISSPANNSSFRGATSVTVSGRAWGDIVFDSIGDEHPYYVGRVEMYRNGTLVGNATLGATGVDPNTDVQYRDYSYTFSGLAPGSYTFGAKAFESNGTQNSGLVTINVTITANAAPTVSVTAPAANTVVTLPGSITLTASASDSDGSVANVQYFVGSTAISGVLTSAPYSFSWSGIAAGNNDVFARVTDNEGALGSSGTVRIVGNDRPTVTLSTSGANATAPGTITLQSTASDGVGGVTKVVYYANGSAISGDLTASPFTFNWTSVARGSYSIVARVTDAYGVTTDSSAFNWTVNQAPSIALTAFASGTVYTAPSSLNLTVNASDTDGSVTSVQYYLDGNPLGSAVTAAPFSFTWSSPAIGSHTLTARATDNSGASATSAPISVIINDVPTVTLTSSNITGTAPGSITLTATTSDSVGGVTNVQYFKNGVALSSPITAAPYTYNWTGVAAGSYSLVARVTDVHGATKDSTAFNWTVNQAPSISLTAFASGAVFNAPSSLTLTVTASDSDGSVASVQYYLDGSLLGAPVTSAPFSYTWNAPSLGSHTITARATDNSGASTTSSAVSVTVNDRPTVSLTASSPNNTAPGSLALQASASDAVGGVSSVQYFANGTAISGALTGAPYNFNWASIAAGSYSVVARVTDGYGTTADSAAYALTVTNLPLPSATLAGPANGALYAPGSTVDLAATVAANGNTISKLEFFDGTTLIGQGVLGGGRYTFAWSPTVGSHNVTAKVTDSFGRTYATAGAVVTVVAPALPTPPNLSGALAGSLAGTPSVSQSGAATYSVPLAAPPGTAGLAPVLELRYSSQTGTTLSGVGWSLSGLSNVTRCAKTVAQDGVRSGVNLTAADQYCLDGQRLLLVTGTHGATAEYRTEVDQFSRVLSYGNDPAKGPDRWAVTSKAGITTNFGATADSNIKAQGTSITLTWALSSTVDPRGNTAAYQYTNDATAGEFVPSQILYTSNPNTAPPLAPYNAVRFEYESRPDTGLTFVMGSKLTNSKRLTAVRTYTNIATDGTGGSLVRQFLIGYTVDPNTGKSLIQTIQDCDAAGTCLPGTNFAWTQRTAADNTQMALGSGTWGGFPVQVGAKTGLSDFKKKVRPVDLNGDGRQDLVHTTGDGSWNVCLSTGAAFNCQIWSGPTIGWNSSDTEDAPFNHVLFGDFNGDGRTDIAIVPVAQNQFVDWTVCYSTGASFDCRLVNFWSAVASVGSGGVPSDSYRVGDFDGDGRDDVAGVAVLSTSPYTAVEKLCTSTGTGFACKDYPGVRYVSPTLVDLDGDGRVDGYAREYNSANGQAVWAAYLSGDSALTKSFTGQSSAPFHYGTDTVPTSGPFVKSPRDHNGDIYGSYADFLTAWLVIGANTGSAELCRSTGKSFDCSTVTGLSNDLVNLPATQADYQDFDGDGRPDVLARPRISGPNPQLCQVQQGPVLQYGLCVDYVPAASGGIDGDFNGDGLPDVVAYNGGNFNVQLAGGTRPMLLSRVTDGYGAATEYSYKLLVDDSVYVQDSGSKGATYPQRDIRDNTAVVSQMRADNGQGGWWTLDYRYGGMKKDLVGRDSLGFRWMEVTDSKPRVTTRTEFAQSFPHTGKTALIVQKHANGVELKRVETTFGQMATAGGAQFLYVQNEVTTTKDLNGAALSTVTTSVPLGAYDAYGNKLTTVSLVQGGGESFSAITNDTFDNFPSGWQIGLLRQTQVTKSAPSVPNVTRTVTKDYDSFGNLLRETVEPNDVKLKLVTEHTRDGFGNIKTTTLKWTDPASGAPQQRITVTNTYDSRGRWATTVTNALNQSEVRTFDDGYGNKTSVTSPNQLTTTTQYDGWGRKVRETDPDGGVTSVAYRRCVDTCGGAVMVKVQQKLFGSTPIAAPKEEFFDRLGRTVQTRNWGFSGAAIFSQHQYDSATGLLQQETRPYFAGATPVWTSYAYDDLGRKTAVVAPTANGGTQQATISYNGLTSQLVNPKQQIKTKLRDALGRVKQITDALNNVTGYQYDAFGNLLKTTDPLGNQIQLGYDLLGRKVQLQDPDLGLWRYDVDPLGQTYRQTDARQQVTQFTFDALGRMTRRLEPDLDSYWVYDSAVNGIGKLAEAYTLRGDGSKDYRRAHTFDGLGRPSKTTVTLDQDYASTLSYDVYGRVKSEVMSRDAVGVTGGPANTVEYGYNTMGELAQMRVSTAANAIVVHQALVEDAEGRLTREGLGNGLYTNRSFNPYVGTLDRLSTGRDNGAGADDASIQNDTYLYDALNNVAYRAQLVDNSGTLLQEVFDYDELNRVKSSQVAGQTAKAYSYDALGNLKSRTGVGTYSYGSRPHGVASVTGSFAGFTNPSFDYDANGNTLVGLGRSYTWTGANLPATVGRSNPLVGTTVNASFVYGPEHQRLKQALSNGITLIYADGIEKETNATGWRLKTYLPHGIGYVEETGFTPTPSVRYFHTDHQGSVIGVTDAAGVALERLSYDVWGQRRNANGSDDATYALKATQDRTGYTGQEELEELALVHMNGRVYDPLVGRFTSADPTVPNAQDQQNFNRYSYVLNNPLRYTDPSGFEAAMVPAVGVRPSAFMAGASVIQVVMIDSSGTNPTSEGQREQTKEINRQEIQAGVPSGEGGGQNQQRAANIQASTSLSSKAKELFAQLSDGLRTLMNPYTELVPSADSFLSGARRIASNCMGAPEACATGNASADGLANSAQGASRAVAEFGNGAVQVGTAVAVSLDGAATAKVSATGAESVVNGLKLNKALASQAQMGEVGTTMAGAGAKVPFRDAALVAEKYGGNAADWVKKTSSSRTTRDGITFETHWVENVRTGQRVLFKTKFPE